MLHTFAYRPPSRGKASRGFGALALTLLFLNPFEVQPSEITNALTISSITAAGKPILFGQDQVKFKTSPQDVVFHFGPGDNHEQSPAPRLRCKLEGYETDWHIGGGEMLLAVRFYNGSGDQMDQRPFKVHGDSSKWNGSMMDSPLTHRRETLKVPPMASRVMIVISSAGPPATEGIYAVANLSVQKFSSNSPPIELIPSPFERQNDENINETPRGWMRDGNRASMAKIVLVGGDSATKALAILDDNVASHAEWRNPLAYAPKVVPGDSLVVEWNEMYCIGVGDFRQVTYGDLAPGIYEFVVQKVDIYGQPTGDEVSLKVTVTPPFWKSTSFWALMIAVVMIVSVGVGRYVAWQKMRREISQLRNQQALEHERLRIAHDIHDDLGARVTQIALLSAMSQERPGLSEKAREDFNQISRMSRELVSALYETVWTVTPENDNLDALGNYACQMVNQLCTSLPLRCRFHVQDLPREIEVSSQIRHNISMTVREAVHNVIKHAGASEVSINMSYVGTLLAIAIQDDGCGFQPANNAAGHGLTNMKRRLEDIGGHCYVESLPGKGTTIRIELTVKAPARIP
jgi:signal transduction histidine kinase